MQYGRLSPWLYFKEFFYVLLGDFQDYKGIEQVLDKDLFFIIFFFTTVFSVILMLNLLFAIISDSFTNIMAVADQTDVFEKLQTICEKINQLRPAELESLKNNLKGVYLFQIKIKNEPSRKNNDEQLRDKRIEKIEQFIDHHIGTYKIIDNSRRKRSSVL